MSNGTPGDAGGEPSPLDSCPAAVFSDADGCVVRWNPACVLLLGSDAAKVLGRPLSSVLELIDRRDGGQLPERRWAVTGPRRVPVDVIAPTADDESRP